MSDMSNPKTAVYTLGERIRKAREDMNWQQADLADGVKKSRPTIAGWENNKHRPSALELDFAVTLQVRRRDADEGWIDIERVDCAHGGVHVDRNGSKGQEKVYECVPADCRDNLDRAFQWGLKYIWDTDERLRGLL